MSKYNFVIVGGGTAGIIAATLLKRYWSDRAEVTLIYDHSKPSIGVGESLTPLIYSYLKYVGISREELIKHVNATVKLGLRFENWRNDNKYYYHSFYEANIQDDYNIAAGHEIANGTYISGPQYSSFYHENCMIPEDPEAGQSLHIDAVLFSKYVENKFGKYLNIIDDEVIDVKLGSEGIDTLILKNRGEFKGNFYIDATGFQKVLFNKLDVKWNDMTDWLPINRCIPNPMSYEFTQQPTYTISEATTDGWILQVPLSNRWGTGYLFNSEFTTEEQAFDRFSKFLKTKYNASLTNTSKVLSFDSGYWEDQWVGNCICIGLASGFSEPLEATNIHHTVYQMMKFTDMFALKITEYDRQVYNETMRKFYKNVYLYLRFCYHTGRTDSDFWKYITNNTPPEINHIAEKVRYNILNKQTTDGEIFNFHNFTIVANGLGLIDKDSYKKELLDRMWGDRPRQTSETILRNTLKNQSTAINHKKFIDHIRNS